MLEELLVPTSPRELIDKISILEIKCERIADATKVANVHRELAILRKTRNDRVADNPDLSRLHASPRELNEALWEIEDAIRDCERNKDFGDTFIQRARSVYFTDDRRAALKREINVLCGSLIIEKKSYRAY